MFSKKDDFKKTLNGLLCYSLTLPSIEISGDSFHANYNTKNNNLSSIKKTIQYAKKVKNLKT